VELAEQTSGNTITLAAPNLRGYQVSYYLAEDGGEKGKVRLRFTSAETTSEGKTNPEPNAPALPFQLPTLAEHIRLIYLIRESSSDHNMAIAASERLDVLNAFTDRFLRDPSVCKESAGLFCVFVPLQVAVTPVKAGGEK